MLNKDNDQGGSSSAQPLGFTGALTILFVALKLTGYIDWSWWWVLSPVLFGLGLFGLFLLGAVVFVFWPGAK